MPSGVLLKYQRNVTFGEKEHPVLTSGRYVNIAITDSGIGLPKEIIPKIFDPFFTTKSKGHGLGLATCFSIISRHDGYISVESEQGKGTVFHIYLPASDEAAPSKTAESDTVHHGSGEFLIMDDEEVMRDILRGMLTNLGYTVLCAQDGKEAVSLFLQETKAGRHIRGMLLISPSRGYGRKRSD